MTPEQWQRIEELVEAALLCPDPQRARFLSDVCGDDGDLRRELESLLHAYEQSHEFLEGPPGDTGGIPAWRDLDARLADGLAWSGRDDQLGGSLAAPDTIGVYRVVRELGSGGMGTVYLAERSDDEFRHQVAIKVMRAGLAPAMQRRFRSERQILASLTHENIARLLDGGTLDDGRPYIVMEYIQGTPIDEYCRRHALSIDDRLKLFGVVCDAVQYAHRNLILHLDAKPANILVTAEGQPKLLDFGIAKLMRTENLAITAVPTSTGFRPLTPQYASPEQVQGNALTTASDVYSLGMVLYRLLAGVLPYRIDGILIGDLMPLLSDADVKPPSAKVAERASQAHADEKRALTQLRQKLRGDLDAIALMALRKEPDRRYTSVAALRDDITRYLERRPVTATRGTFSYRLGKLVRRHKLAVAATTLVFALVSTFAVIVTFQARALAQRSDALRRERDQVLVQKQKAQATAKLLMSIFHSVNGFSADDGPLTAEELLDRGTNLLAGRLSTHPDVRAEIQLTLAQVYRQLDVQEKAYATVVSALRFARDHLAPDHRVIVALERELAIALVDEGRYDEAEKLYLRVLDHKQRVLGQGAVELAGVLQPLSLLYLEREMYEHALRPALRALELHEACGQSAACREEHPRYAKNGELVRLTVAWSLLELGRYEWAFEVYREAELGIRQLGMTQHVYYAYVLEGLCLARHRSAQAHDPTPEGASSCTGPDCPLAMCERAHDLVERTVGPRHQTMIEMRGALAEVLVDHGLYDRAATQLQLALALAREKLPASSRKPGRLLRLRARLPTPWR